jgi:hypothetical protein
MTTICRFRLSCGGKPTDAGFIVSTRSFEGPTGPSFFRPSVI